MTRSHEEFLQASLEEVHAVAPATLIYTPGGTRRQAALAGIRGQGAEYIAWARMQLVRCIETCFRLGIQHVFTGMIQEKQLAEIGPYRASLFKSLDWVLNGPEALADWQRLGCRVRLLSNEAIPEVLPIANRLHAATEGHNAPTLWAVVSSSATFWGALLPLIRKTGARTRRELVQALCGEDIPPAPLWISFGKPRILADPLPMLFIEDEIQCYWMQQPGYSLTEHALRAILYDHVFLRSTWSADKSERYADIGAQRVVWDQPVILGLGQHVGPFWYPSSDTDLYEKQRGA